MNLSLDNRVFGPVENSENGVVNNKTRFHFWQEGMVFYADYFGGDVREGHIIGQFTAVVTISTTLSQIFILTC